MNIVPFLHLKGLLFASINIRETYTSRSGEFECRGEECSKGEGLKEYVY